MSEAVPGAESQEQLGQATIIMGTPPEPQPEPDAPDDQDGDEDEEAS